MKSSIRLFVGVFVGKIEFENIATRKKEIFYRLTIFVLNTPGTAPGGFVADDIGLGFELAAPVFAGLTALAAAAYYFTNISGAIYFSGRHKF